MQDLATKFANLTIQSDFVFKKVMSRKRICKHLLEELLQAAADRNCGYQLSGGRKDA